MSNQRRGFPTLHEAQKFLEIQRIMHPGKTKNWSVWDLSESHPRRTSTRFFVGDDQEWGFETGRKRR